MAYRFNLPRDDVGDGIADFGGAQIFVFDFGTVTPKTTFSDFALTVPNTDPVVADADGLFGDIFVDIQCSMELQTFNDVSVYTADVFAPEDGISTLAAADVSVADSGGFYTPTVTVESALAELGADYSLGAVNTVVGLQTFSGGIALADAEIGRGVLTDYAVTSNAVASSSNVITLDMTTGNVFTTTLTEDITTVTLSNPPATGSYGELLWIITQDGASGAFTVAFPAAVLWPSGTAPTITVSNDAVDEVTLHTVDAGTTYLGNFTQAFS